MNEKTVSVGIVGAGANTRSRHIPGLKVIAGVQLVGVANRTAASSRAVAQEFGIPTMYDDWRQAVEDKRTNAIVIGTWPYMHCPVTLAALAAGKHVLCEARMAMNAAEAHAMLDASRRRPDLVAQIVPSPFTLAVDAMVRKLIAEGYLGQILAVEVRGGGGWLERTAPLHWRQDFDLSGYNVLSLGIWYESVMRWLGPCRSVMAMGKTFIKMRADAAGTIKAVRVPEHLDVVADMVCGAQGHFQISAVTAMSGASEIILFGSDGVLKFSQDHLYGAARGEEEMGEIPIPQELLGRWRVEEDWINAIRGLEGVGPSTFQEGVHYMEFTEAVARSMADGRQVTLPLM